MSIKEISDCLNISISNVKVRIHRAKSILKEKLLDLAKNKDVFEFGFSRCDSVTENVMRMI
jgi:RNA polymerase sigma-70 factor (ECF subfamily)